MIDLTTESLSRRQPLLQLPKTDVDHVAARGEGHTDEAFGTERRARHQVDVGLFEERGAEGERVRDRLVAEPLSEIGRDMEEGIERPLGSRELKAGDGAEAGEGQFAAGAGSHA